MYRTSLYGFVHLVFPALRGKWKFVTGQLLTIILVLLVLVCVCSLCTEDVVKKLYHMI